VLKKESTLTIQVINPSTHEQEIKKEQFGTGLQIVSRKLELFKKSEGTKQVSFSLSNTNGKTIAEINYHV
jgi:hypothetical protein